MNQLVAGTAEGRLLVLDEPISFWGGIDPETGTIVDPTHPQRGEVVKDSILVVPHGRGSSSSSSVLAEMLRRGVGPAGMVLEEPDPIILIGVLVANILYDTVCPVITLEDVVGAAGRWRILEGMLEPCT